MRVLEKTPQTYTTLLLHLATKNAIKTPLHKNIIVHMPHNVSKRDINTGERAKRGSKHTHTLRDGVYFD